MMRSVAAALAMFTLAGGLSGPVSQGPRPADGTGSSIIGSVVKYESTTHTLTLITASGRKSVVLPRTAQVRQGPRLMAPGELSKHIGSKAKVRYTESHGILTAESVMLSISPD
jgi:hypothetical protein